MLVQITDAGLALMQGATQPLVMTSYELGSDYGYTPSPTQTALQGSVVYTGVPSSPVTTPTNNILYACHVPGNVGPFQFGEIGLYYGTTLFAVCVVDELIDKEPLDVNFNTGGPVVIDFFVPMTSTNYQMWANATQSNVMKASTVTGPEGLPPSPNAVPNLFVVEAAGGRDNFMAFSDRFGVWVFTGFGRVATVTVVSANQNSVTVSAASVAAITFQGLGTLLSQFTTGAAYSTARYIDGMTPNAGNVVLSFNAPLVTIPNAGDQFELYEPQTTQVPSGSTGPGIFTTLTSTAATSLGPTQAVSLNNTPIGATTASTGRFTTLVSTGAATLASLSVSGGINNTVIGATTPAAATVTDLVVTSSFSGPGLAALFASPGPIGSTTPSTGSFTTLTASGTTTLGALIATSINGATIGATTPGSGRFTTLQATGASTLNGIVNTGNSVLAGVTATTATFSGAVQVASLTVTGASTFSSINSTPIGNTTPSTGAFTTLSSTGNTNLGVTTTGALVATSLNSTPIGATTASTGRFTTLTATGAATLAAVTAGAMTATSLDATPVGATTASTGRFTTLVSTGTLSTGGGLTLSGTTGPITLNGNVGTSGQVLTSAGPGAVPTWSTVVTGGSSPTLANLSVTGSTTLNTLSVSGGINNTIIGGTTPAAGTFTALVASGVTVNQTLTLAGPIQVGASQGTVGQVLTSGGSGNALTWTSVVVAGSSPTFPGITISGTATIATAAITTENTTTANIQTLNITGNNRIQINGSSGAAGQVLVSQGNTNAPQWQNLVVTNAALTSGTINGVTIGATTPSTGVFTSLNLNGLTSPMLLTGSAGTTGQVLTSQGPGATPIWTTPASGGGGGGAVVITSGTIDGVVIGGSNPGVATFTDLTALGTISLGITSTGPLTTTTISASGAMTSTSTISATGLTLTANLPLSINSQTGTTGQVLISQGGSAAPTWGNPTSSPVAAITSGSIAGVAITTSTMDSTVIGGTTPAAATVTTLTATGATTLAALQSTGIEGSPIGTTTASTGRFTTLQSTGAATLGATTATSINSTPIGATTASTGAFTTLTASGAATLAALTATSINSTPIGATTASTGRFTTLTATGATTLTTVSTTGLTLASTTSAITLNASAGTSGQVLTSAGPGATPTWTARAPDLRAVTAISSLGGVLTIDCSLGDYFTVALSENVTSIAFTNVPSAATGARKTIVFTQDATARTVAWPAAFKWAGGTPGVISTGAGAIDKLVITTLNGGTSWLTELALAYA
jgi:hypothetical protein